MEVFIYNGLLLTGTFVAMEGVAWLTHKYVMHGALWVFHKDHHRKDHKFPFERNDFFFLIFALPGITLAYFGFQEGLKDFKLWIGAGITLYGLAYFLVHDVFIHQRIKFFKRTNNTYLRAIRKAHKVHHKHLGKEEGECFGMLWVPLRYFREMKSTRNHN